MRYMGVDVGKKYTGVAVSDSMGSIAFPKAVVRSGDAFEYIIKEIKYQNIGGIVFGESHKLGGGENPIMQEVHELKNKLQNTLGETISFDFEPEWYTTKEASRIIKTNARLDARAAAIILNSFLSRKKKDEREGDK